LAIVIRYFRLIKGGARSGGMGKSKDRSEKSETETTPKQKLNLKLRGKIPGPH
jgi:hypothetical protein